MKILEIGAGNTLGTYWTATIERMELDPSQQYVGLDIGVRGSSPAAIGLLEQKEAQLRDRDMRQKWAAIQAGRPDENIHFLQADGAYLPFVDESFDRVVASNVFGFGADEDSLPNILLEADRVLRPGGEIVLHDDHSPRSRSLGVLSAWFRSQELEFTGIPKDIHAFYGPDEYAAACKRYGFKIPIINEDDPHKTLLEEIHAANTIWILGKSAFKVATTYTRPPEAPYVDRAKPGNLFPALRRTWKNIRRHLGR